MANSPTNRVHRPALLAAIPTAAIIGIFVIGYPWWVAAGGIAIGIAAVYKFNL